MDPLQPQDPTELGDWKIIARLASSENSTIYLGHKGIEGLEQAAIKVLSEEISADLNAVDRLKIEAEALKKISNPYIAKLIDYNFNSKPVWIATEYIDRKTLDVKLKQDGKPITGQEWWQLAAKIFNGLKAIHAEKIIHKDIKPANIIIAGDQVKIIDFGISYVPGNTGKIDFSAIQFEGSRPFAAPENFNGKDSEKMDVFSAAVTLAYAGKLRSIWKDENESTLRNSVIKEKPDLDGLQPEQTELLEPLLDKFPSQRPSSEEAFNKITQYIEYLVGINDEKPLPLKGSSFFYKLFKSTAFRTMVIGVTVLGIFLSLALRPTQTIYVKEPINSQVIPETKATVDPVASPSQISDLDNLPRNSNEIKCQTAINASLYDDAIKLCLQAINEGDIRALFVLGSAYSFKKEDALAMKYFKLAAAKGYERAIGVIALQYEMILKDPSSAAIWYKKAQNSKLPENLVLAALYLKNNKQFTEAEKLLLNANSLGLTWATTELGNLYNELKNYNKAATYLKLAAQAGDDQGMFAYAELVRIQYKNFDEACNWYNRVVSIKSQNNSLNQKSQAALINFCQSGLTGAPPVAENLISENLLIKPYNSESLKWIIPSEEINVDFNFVQFKLFGNDNKWQGISYSSKDSSTGQPWLEIIFTSAATDKCFDFRLIKIERGLVTKIWSLLPSGCYSYSTGSPVRLR